MSFKRKILIKNLVPIAGLLLMGGVALWGLIALRTEVHDALAGSQELRAIDDMTTKIMLMRNTLSGTPETAKEAAADIGAILPDLRKLSRGGWNSRDALTRDYDRAIAGSVGSAAGHLEAAAQSLGAPQPAAQQAIPALEEAKNDLGGVIKMCEVFIDQRNRAADEMVATITVVMGGLFAVTLVSAGASSVLQYRGVMRPLQRLREGVRKLAAAQFADRLPEDGDREFADLAVEFNRMAGELQSFYRELEEKVNAKSKELVRSERLASVGFLAAGVAHEINNPLNIVSGYAELTEKRLSGPVDAATAAEARKCLQIIRDEAFRCKDITEKLLSLTKGGNDHRELLSLADVAKEVAVMTRGLKNYRDRKLRLRFAPEEPLDVMAQRTEMKQVLLNLTVNALDAVKPGEGEVCIEGRRTKGWIELTVKDNGRGMGAETLKHVFEPFFTDKRGFGEPGTGLGLSITHAIVENHGGRIRAESEGPGLGARFTIELPVPQN